MMNNECTAMSLTEAQLRDIAITVAFSAHRRNTTTDSRDMYWHDAELFAQRQMLRAITGGEYSFAPISINPKFYRTSFPGAEAVELDYQVNVAFYRSNDWGNDLLFAEVAVGYATDGYTYTEVAYY